jgi:hypothetical protein
MLEDGHRALKRWERARQLEGLRQEAESAGPLVWCRIRADGAPDRIPVHLLALFEGDFAYVRAAGEAAPPGVPGPAWLARGAIEWETYLPLIIRHYGMGRPVPGAFAPIRKLPRELLEKLGNLPHGALPAVFAKLRSEGLLPALPALARGTCPPGLPWEDLRARFQDFRDPKDNPPR